MPVKKNETSRTRTRSRKTTSPDDFSTIFRCYKCGKVTERPMGTFYKTNSKLWAGNDYYFPICADCLNELLQEYIRRYDARTAMMLICHYMDIPFSNTMFDSMNMGGKELTVGAYSRLVNNIQFAGKTFINTILEGELLKEHAEVLETRETKWSKADLKNKQYVISSLGYDPYEDESYLDEDRKFLFNTLSSYLTDEVLEDPHRTQSAVNMMPTILQRNKVDKLINADLLSRAPSNLKQYTDAKVALDRTMSTIANENGFSVKGAGRAGRSSSAITQIMRNMEDDGFEACKVNVINAKTADAYQQVADISNKSLMNQLNWQDDDYARMVATQRDIIRRYELIQIKLIEEARQLRAIASDLSKNSKIKLPPVTDTNMAGSEDDN
ncbi:hypothetical protein D7X33_07265 [Butyricicoccus sp. 1XD8-22]|nr:hypothetical protein D7X33_07265 [Butyricicoccus sp. 1XD8-22]